MANYCSPNAVAVAVELDRVMFIVCNAQGQF